MSQNKLSTHVAPAVAFCCRYLSGGFRRMLACHRTRVRLRWVVWSAASALGIAVFLPAAAPPGWYEIWKPDRTGITWRHDNGISARRYIPETMGPGVAVFDYNNDGLMDLYFPNSGPCDFFQPSRPLRGALYRNNGDGTFTDVTERAGVANSKAWGIGAAAADFDGDGWVDLLVTNYGRNTLYRNRGDGTFEDVTEKAGLAAPGLYTSAVWFDYDNNGTLDLYVGHFVHYSKQLEPECKAGGIYHYCYPAMYDPWPSKLYRNNGDGTFTDVSQASGIGKHPGKAFGAVAVDFDGDGYLDLFVTNDSLPNFLFRNKGDGTFEEIGLEAGVAYSDDGVPRSSMGVDAADYDGDGRPDLVVTNFNRERASIYRNRGGGLFEDRAGPTGVGAATYMWAGWGVRFFDFDNDGRLDLVLANGYPGDSRVASAQASKWNEPLFLFSNRDGKFVNLGSAAGEAFTQEYPARGLAVGDLDNDGWPDIVVANNGDVPLVLHNRGGTNHWIGLEGMVPGAVVRWPGGIRFITAGGSFLCSHDPRLIIGLGRESKLAWLEIDWPAPRKRTERLENLAGGKYYKAR